MATYTIKHSHGQTDYADSLDAALAQLREVYGDEIETEGDLEGNSRILVWQDEESARDDDGQRAVASIRVSHEVQYTIEGLADGAWCREHVGANESNLFASRNAAEAELPALAAALDCEASELRVVEVQS